LGFADSLYWQFQIQTGICGGPGCPDESDDFADATMQNVGDSPDVGPQQAPEASAVLAGAGGLAQIQTPWSISWQINASTSFFVAEVQGVADVTIAPLVNAVEHPIGTVQGLGNGAFHPVATARNIATAAVSTSEAAASGDPRAFGQVVGTLAAFLYAAENIKVRSYENAGGGGLNIRNTPTTGSSIRLDFHPIEEGVPYLPHVDITIKKPGVPSGPGSNLIKPIQHWPWGR